MYSHNKEETQNIIIRPTELLARLRSLHGDSKTVQSYLQITQKNKCWETRGLNKNELERIALGSFKHKERDFTGYLNNWEPIIKKLK